MVVLGCHSLAPNENVAGIYALNSILSAKFKKEIQLIN